MTDKHAMEEEKPQKQTKKTIKKDKDKDDLVNIFNISQT